MNAKLAKKIDAFLAEKRKSEGGGWAEIKPDDVDALYDIVLDLITAKCEFDADGDLPIEFTLVNRLVTHSLNFRPVPYNHQRLGSGRYLETIEHCENAFDVAMFNLSIATNSAKLEYDLLQCRKREEEAQKLKEKK